MAIRKNSDGKTARITRSAGEQAGSATPNRTRANQVATPKSDPLPTGRVRKSGPRRQTRG